MEPFDHPACRQVIGKPSDMTEGECVGLPVLVHKDDYGTWAVSFWRPSAEELAQLVGGGFITLQVRDGDLAHPVVSLNTQPKED